LLLPALSIGAEEATRWRPVLITLGGLMAGCAFLWLVERHLSAERVERSPLFRVFGGRVEALVFLAMAFHSLPEGIAVGVGFASEEHLGDRALHLGETIAVAISIHNIPEGLAVALPLRAAGASIQRCFWLACLTSLPQPIAAVPASLLVWLFEPLMLPFLGFAAGAMMYLVIVELIPDGLATQSRAAVAWWFMIGFSLMLLVQLSF
jgi:zinc transporter ZupT